MIYEKGEVVSATKCDVKANLSLIGAVELVQDNICFYFGNMKIDQIIMKNHHNAIWMYTKNKLKFYHDLTWNDKFLLRCFISQITPVRLIVDTVFFNDNKDIALYSKVELCLFDLENHKLKRITPDIISPDYACHKSLMDYSYDKLLFDDSFTLVDEVKIRAGNIDYCIHTNNIEYLRFILNTFNVKMLAEERFKEVEIHYLAQSKENDTIQIYKSKCNDKHDFLIKHVAKDIIKCRIITEHKLRDKFE
ncbi:MAG: hypothetical protein GX490_04645 [Bacilli bacterium]|nr:hypothetical protein [Bacilli bacterium]